MKDSMDMIEERIEKTSAVIKNKVHFHQPKARSHSRSSLENYKSLHQSVKGNLSQQGSRRINSLFDVVKECRSLNQLK